MVKKIQVDKDKILKKGSKTMSEFKAFISKGNVMDMAVGVIIGGAFTGIVTALTDDFINPLINCIGGAEVSGRLQIFNTGQYLNWGHFLTAVINFLIMAAVLFLILKSFTKLMNIGKKQEEPKKEEPPKKADDVLLLEEIRDLLKEKNKETKKTK